MNVREDGTLAFSMRWEALAQEELLLVFAAQRGKARYYRLQDGAFLTLEDLGAAAAADFADKAGLLQARSAVALFAQAPYFSALARDSGVIELQTA